MKLKISVILVISYCISTICMEHGLADQRLKNTLSGAINKLTQGEVGFLWTVYRNSKSYNPALFSATPHLRIQLAAADLPLEIPLWQPSTEIKKAVKAITCIIEHDPSQSALIGKLLLPHVAKKFLPWFTPLTILVTTQAPSGGKFFTEENIVCKNCRKERSSNNECTFCYKKNKIIKNFETEVGKLSNGEIVYMRRVTESFLESEPLTNPILKPSESLAICIYEKTGLANITPTKNLATAINLFGAGVILLEQSSPENKELETYLHASAETACKHFMQGFGRYWQ